MADNDTITIDVEVDAKDAAASLAKIKKGIKDVEAETVKLTASQKLWSAANADIGKTSQGWRNVAEDVGKVTGVLAGLAAVGVTLMAQEERQEAAVRRLGSAYEAVSVATNGAMSATQALTLQGQIQAAGVQVNAQQLGLLARAAREYAQATGNDAAQAVEKLTNAIVNNSEDALSELGLAQARATTSTQTLANMTRELETRFQGTSPAARTLTEDLQKLPEVLTLIGNSAAQTAAGGLARFIDAVNGAGTAARIWQDIVGYRDTQRNLAQQQRSTETMELRRQQRERTGTLFREGNVRINETNASNFGDFSSLTEQERGRVNRAANPLFWVGANASESVNRELAAISEERMQRQAAEGQRSLATTAMNNDIERKRRKPRGQSSGGGGGGGSDLREARAEYNRALAAAIVVGAPLVEPSRAPGQTLEEYWRARASAQQQANRLQEQAREETRRAAAAIAAREEEDAFTMGDKNRSLLDAADEAAQARRARTQRIDRRNRETRRMAREGSLGGRVASSLGFATDDEGRIAQFDGIRAGAELLTGTVNTLTNGLTSLFDTLVSGSADAGTAFQSFASGLLTELGKMAVNKGLFYTFEGIAALFTAPPAAPLYFAAGAGLLALGAGLGIAGAATKPQVPGNAADTSTARSLAPRSNNSGASSRDLAPVTVVMSSLVPAGPGDAQRLRNGVRDAQRRGFGGDFAPRRVEH